MITTLPQPILPPSPLDLRVVFIATYPPRRCGIGTYTKDLATGINSLNADRLCEIIALDNNLSEPLEYPWEVSHRIRQNEWSDYEKVLDYLNNSVIDIVALQHEYGIWGGPDGEYIIKFMQKLKKPFIVTFHSVLENPSPNQKRILQEISKRARALVVMLPVTGEILKRVYNTPIEKVVPIHHGAPDFPFFEDNDIKRELGLEGKIVMSNINLIGRGRGIEYAIQALPEVVKQYPNFHYLIIGQTHPVVLENEGEQYRESLVALVKELGLEKNVQFINKYVSLEDLIEYVKASDFYITPYEEMAMTSSGSLAYAIAAGKLCISTPYLYAQEMLAGGRGYLVEPKNPQSITQAILQGISSPQTALKMRQKCYAQGRTMTWDRIGFRYLRVMEHILGPKPVRLYPAPKLDYLHTLTHPLGIIEHTNKDRALKNEGYATDDNARALMVALQYGEKELAQRYLDFLTEAEVNGTMYCDRTYKGKWVGKPGLGDWFGRAFWAAAYTVQHGSTASMRRQAAELVSKLLPNCQEVTPIRTLSYILLGLARLQEAKWDHFIAERQAILDYAITSIQSEYTIHSSSEWKWPEAMKSYDNARLPQALLEVARVFNRPDLQTLGVELMNFVIDSNFEVLGNHFRFIGNKGWYKKSQPKALFDEQPIEAGSMVQACFTAYQTTGLNYYKDMAKKAMAWFHGDNIHRRPLYSVSRGSVYDGITKEGINLNQGAESTLEYLLAFSCYAKLVEEGLKTSGNTNSTASN